MKGASNNLLSAIEHTYPKFVWEKLPYFPLSCSGTRIRPWYNNDWLPYLRQNTTHFQQDEYVQRFWVGIFMFFFAGMQICLVLAPLCSLHNGKVSL